MDRIAVYPGTFDPITNGHIDLIDRTRRQFGRVIVGVAERRDKQPLFDVSRRVEMIQQVTSQWSGVTVESFDGLLVDFLRSQQAQVVIRGLRAVSDFEYELQMALTNRQMYSEIETIFLMPSLEYIYLSSSIVKAVSNHGGDISKWVPPVVAKALKEKYGTISDLSSHSSLP
jgi:pantetheine-phosphate adenylyltransferase